MKVDKAEGKEVEFELIIIPSFLLNELIGLVLVCSGM